MTLAKWTSILRLACLATLILGVATLPPIDRSGAFAQPAGETGVIGDDDRRPADSRRAPWSSVGRLNFAGHGFCTATLVAPAMVATAAHCLFNPRNAQRWPPEEIHFLAGWHRETYLSHSRGRALFVSDDFTLVASPGSEVLEKDLALIALRPAATGAALKPAFLSVEEALETDFLHASYSRDRPYMLSVQDSCQVLKANRRLWLTDCDTNHGGSGAPLLVRRGGEVLIAGIMVAYAAHEGDTVSVVVPLSSPAISEVLGRAGLTGP
jgi:protease YdgD